MSRCKQFLSVCTIIVVIIFTTTIASLAQCVPSDTSLISWWPMDEDTGTIVSNIGGAFNAIRINGPTSVPGKVGKALKFDGINDYVAIPDNDLWAFGSRDFTIEFWASFDAPERGTLGHPGYVFISHNDGSGTNRKWFFALGGGVLNFHVNGPGTSGRFFPQVPFSPVAGRWYHLAVTRKSSTYTIYVDGVARGSAINTDVIPNANVPLTIGQSNEPFGGFMNGSLDEMTIYNRALSGSEILAITNASNVGKCKNLAITTSTL